MAINKIWLGDEVGFLGDLARPNNWSPAGVPLITDNIRLPATSSQAMTTSLSTLAGVAIGDFIVEEGFTKAIGDKDNYLVIVPGRFEYAGTGDSFIDVQAAPIDLVVTKTGSASAGKRKLHLLGSAIGVLSVNTGSVGVAFQHGETSTVATIRAIGSSADIVSGQGVTLTGATVSKGKLNIRGGLTLLEVYGGICTTEEIGVVITCNVFAGSCFLNSAGDVTTLTIRGGLVDMLGQGLARTITNLNAHRGQLKYDPQVVTITNDNNPDSPVSRLASAV